MELSLLIDAAVARPGEPVGVGVLFEMDPGWHIYWHNPGELGRATRLDWSVEDGRIGPVQWPAPSVFVESRGPFRPFQHHVRLRGSGALVEPGDR